MGALRASLGDFMPALGAMLEDVKAKAKDMGLQEVSIALGINARGKVGSWDRRRSRGDCKSNAEMQGWITRAQRGPGSRDMSDLFKCGLANLGFSVTYR